MEKYEPIYRGDLFERVVRHNIRAATPPRKAKRVVGDLAIWLLFWAFLLALWVAS